MISLRNKIILTALLTLTAVFVGMEIFKMYLISEALRIFLLPLLFVFYHFTVTSKNKWFTVFLFLYAIAEVLGGLGNVFYTPSLELFLYFFINILYILAYIFLIFSLVDTMDVRSVFVKFPVHILILLALDIYCVVFITNITVSQGDFVGISGYFIEFIYNIVIMLLLTTALINYINRDSKKSMNILLGTLFIILSEVLQIAYYYISDQNAINIVNLVFLILAFFFLYTQAKLVYNKEELVNREFNNIKV